MARPGVSGLTETQSEGTFSDSRLLEALACPACYGALRVACRGRAGL